MTDDGSDLRGEGDPQGEDRPGEEGTSRQVRRQLDRWADGIAGVSHPASRRAAREVAQRGAVPETPDDDDVSVIICSPKVDADGNLTKAVAGSTDAKCADCGEDVWLAASSKEIIDEFKGETFVVCIACGMARMILDEQPQVMPTTIAQMAEIKEFFEGEEDD